MVEGRRLACRWVRLACARHLQDLERQVDVDAFPFWWDASAVEDVRHFFLGLRHSKGEWAGQAIELEAWQLFILGVVFGWKRRVGGRKVWLRRFRAAYVEVPRKNGKSTLAAGIGLLLAFFDDEPGAEVFAAATKRDQAKIVWLEAKRMVLRSPRLAGKITALVGNLHDHQSESRFEPLGADADNLDGLNMHAGIVDELHAHKTRALWDVLETATGARRQPLLFAITTAGANRAGVCYEQRLYVSKILEGVLKDETTFGIIYTADDGDDWREPDTWAKANPNLGISLKHDDLERLATKARETPSAQNAFLTKRLDVWVNADRQWIDIARWERCRGEVDLEKLRDAECYIALDLASRVDVAAMVLLLKRGADYWTLPRFYLPKERVDDGAHAETAHFAGWARAGWVTLTDGNTIDFRVIGEDLKAYCKRLRVVEIPFDPFQATQFSVELREAGLPMVEYQNTVRYMSDPMKHLGELIEQGGRIRHDGNPAMSWMMSNVVCRTDAKDNIFPRKPHPALKIDGPVALIMALGRAALKREPVYNTRGLRMI